VICTKKRRTQAERSAKMQAKILDAALKCICDLGLQSASTHEIARAADISRGALMHHYGSRNDLLKAAFGRILDDEVAMLTRFSENIIHDRSSLKPIIEYIWQRYRGGLFMVTVDYLSQARVDAWTLQSVTTEATRYNDKLNDVWDQILEEVDIPDDKRRSLMNQTMCLIRGMALQRIWRQDDQYFSDMLDDWINSLQDQLGSH